MTGEMGAYSTTADQNTTCRTIPFIITPENLFYSALLTPTQQTHGSGPRFAIKHGTINSKSWNYFRLESTGQATPGCAWDTYLVMTGQNVIRDDGEYTLKLIKAVKIKGLINSLISYTNTKDGGGTDSSVIWVNLSRSSVSQLVLAPFGSGGNILGCAWDKCLA